MQHENSNALKIYSIKTIIGVLLLCKHASIELFLLICIWASILFCFLLYQIYFFKTKISSQFIFKEMSIIIWVHLGSLQLTLFILIQIRLFDKELILVSAHIMHGIKLTTILTNTITMYVMFIQCLFSFFHHVVLESTAISNHINEIKQNNIELS